MILKEILSETGTAGKPVVRKLQQGKATDSHVLAIGLGKEVVLRDHKSDIPAKIVVLKGKMVYKEKDTKVVLQALDEYDIPVGEIHRVEAIEDSLFIVIKG
ncbi:hypothetical protein [Salinimicrobium flavum]|uniref:Cupin domain-containing protein n=1 Tax=Salinimicrobium flavum TaxID=1737065 RepID=A0ABW5IW34_9FLAO